MRRSEPEPATADATWSLPAVWVPFLLFMLAVFTVAGVSIVVQTMAGRTGAPLLFMALWFAALGWNFYWWLFRVAYRVELVGGVLHWRAPLRSGTMPVDAIESGGRFFGAPYTCVLRGGGHQSVLVFTQLRSFAPMLTVLRQLNPAVPAE